MTDFKKRYKRLNKEQKKAVDTLYGPTLVIAGPGAGKTEILTLRVANILKKTNTLPQEILCLTFTDSAASNMKERLQNFIGSKAFKVNINTFHSLGANIINKHPEFFYKGANFNPADEITQTEIIKEIIKELDFDNPLKKSHPEQGFIYLNPIKKSITALKRAGLTAKEFKDVLKKNKKELKLINSVLEKYLKERVSKNNFKNYEKVLEELKDKEGKNKNLLYKNKAEPSFLASLENNLPHIESLTSVVERSFEKALKEAKDKEKTKPITSWKKKWTKKRNGELIFKDEKYTEKLEALAEIYKNYREKLYHKGYYDFDDMILDVIQVLSKNKTFRNEIQEKFDFILVDEFQDTNEAQMRLLHLLSGKNPNIFVVGDDDQAIFKFQGAEVENIYKFRKKYENTKIITLLKNYRSSENVLKTARFIIKKGEKRLENIIPKIQKSLESVNKKREKEFINHYKFNTKEEEYYWVAKKIKNKLKKKDNSNNIAIISRYHKNLQELLPFLDRFNVPISYERQQNVLEEPHIEQIIKIARIVIHLSNNEKKEALSYFPEVLSFPFWEIKREKLLELATESKTSKKDWLECMLNKKGKLNKIANFFLELSNRAVYEPLEKMIDFIIGTKSLNISSPFRSYYFDKDKTSDKLWFLSSLQTFIQKTKNYKEQEFLKLKHLLEFVELHNEINLPLINKNRFSTKKNKVELLSAHKAKGREFDSVFILNCQDQIW
ncbi:MAG: ATP-dependent helicase, partial [Minisyncoccales bacterium]